MRWSPCSPGEGAVAGVGFYLSWWLWFPTQCEPDDGPGCGVAWAAMLPVFLCAWMLVGSALVFLILKVLKRRSPWPAAGLGCALWVPLWFVFVLVAMATTVSKEAGLIGVPVVSYLLGAVFTGSRSSAHGDEVAATP
jgi:hypothetical protein